MYEDNDFNDFINTTKIGCKAGLHQSVVYRWRRHLHTPRMACLYFCGRYRTYSSATCHSDIHRRSCNASSPSLSTKIPFGPCISGRRMRTHARVREHRKDWP